MRRWSHVLDRSQPIASFGRQTFARLTDWLRRYAPADREAEQLSRLTLTLQVLWPLRL